MSLEKRFSPPTDRGGNRDIPYFFPSWASFEQPEAFGRERIHEISQAVVDWHQKYQFNRSLVIRPIPPDMMEEEVTPQGVRVTTLDLSGPGFIMLHPTQSDIKDTVLHAMTHASAPDKPTVLDEPIQLSDAEITGFEGLKLALRLPDGAQAWFKLFEDGMCDRNAFAMKGYSVPNLRYALIGELTTHLFPHNTARRAHELIRKNDVGSFIRSALRLSSTDQLTAEHFERVMNSYDNKWNSV